MWRTNQGDRTIQGAEWALFREALSGLWDRVEEAGDDWRTARLGVELFDELQINQKLAMLVFVGEALSRDDIKPPELTAVGEATIAAVFRLLVEDVAVEADLWSATPSVEDDEPADWTIARKLILAAHREARNDDGECDEEEEGEGGETMEPTSTDLDAWGGMIEELENRILWEDGDHEVGRKFLNLSPAGRLKRAKRLGIDAGYFLAIAPDPTNRQLANIRHKLRVLTGRVALDESESGQGVVNSNGRKNPAGKSTTEVQAVIDQLRSHKDRLEEVRNSTKDCPPLKGNEKKRVQLLMKTAKELMKADDKRMSTVKGKAALNPTERAFLSPAVQEALAEIKVKWNSDPATWSSDLFAAILELNHYLHQLERPEK